MTDSDADADARSRPPETPRRPVTDELHGESITDPYRWLEGDDEEVDEWTAAQNDYAEAVLDTPARAALADRFASRGRVDEYGPVGVAGDRLFQEVRRPDDEQPVVYAYDEAAAVGTDAGTALVDPNDWAGDGTVSVDWFVPGPEGRYLAYGVAEGGDEQYDVRVVGVVTGEPVETVADAGRTQADGFAWVAGDAPDGADATAPDPRGFYYVATGVADGDADADGQLDKTVRFHEFGSGTAPAADHVVDDGVGETTWPTLVADGDALVAQYMEGWERTDLYGYRGDPATATLDPVVTGVDAVFKPTIDGERDRLLVATDHDAAFARVLAAPLADALAGRRPRRATSTNSSPRRTPSSAASNSPATGCSRTTTATPAARWSSSTPTAPASGRSTSRRSRPSTGWWGSATTATPPPPATTATTARPPTWRSVGCSRSPTRRLSAASTSRPARRRRCVPSRRPSAST
ncbi:hypothetical protein ACFQRB_08630 [Halobaculum litoreum]|uniref:Peptidase S9A N-terminal domain-containing protein n=1 Tax=Halobaculum litoreum TaxID=3031998 RepID=A0ABD5XPH2_9EURY